MLFQLIALNACCCILLLLYLVCRAGFGVGGHFVEGVGVVGCVGFVTGVVVVRVSGGVA